MRTHGPSRSWAGGTCGWSGFWGPGDVARLSGERALSLRRDPEFVFYDQLKQVMNAYR